MRCPFLSEAMVRSCERSPGRAVPLPTHESATDALCLSSHYQDCAVARDALGQDGTGRSRCPLLRERLVQYCDAASPRTYVPYIHGLNSRCVSDAFRYCSLYLQRASGLRHRPPHSVVVDQVVVAIDRWYAPEHFWIDAGELGTDHIGVDGFVTRLFDRIDAVHFVSGRGLGQPHVVLVGGGVCLELVLPERVEILETNVHLKTRPADLLADPYRAGWLYQVRGAEAHPRSASARGLIPGEDAPLWMKDELSRIDAFVHDTLLPGRAGDVATICDGGRVADGLLTHLDEGERAQLSARFFARANRRSS